jgi:hypothetical protein
MNLIIPHNKIFNIPISILQWENYVAIKIHTIVLDLFLEFKKKLIEYLDGFFSTFYKNIFENPILIN